jgi:hypothetical protein
MCRIGNRKEAEGEPANDETRDFYKWKKEAALAAETGFN